MRIVIMGAILAMFGVAAPSAQTPTAPAPKPPVAPAPVAPPVGPPRGLPGYNQPEITAAYCRNVSPTQTSCTLPAMTAGRYIVQATGTSTATGPGAAQAVVVQIGNKTCRADRPPSAGATAWTTGSKTIAITCEVIVMADKALPITAYYVDDKATKDPKGPTLVIKRAVWDGVLGVTAFPAQN
jgi:hypothetical protein